MTATETYWQKLGAEPPGSLGEAQLDLLHAARVLWATADGALSQTRDGSHRALRYLPEAGALVTGLIEAREPLRLGLSLCALELVALDEDGALVASQALPRRTLGQLLGWAERTVRDTGRTDIDLELPRPLDLPPHPLASGGTFSDEVSAAARELGRYYADTQLLLESLGEDETGGIVVAPGDLSMLLEIEQGDAPRGRSIAVGLSLADELYGEPYWLVRPNPTPEIRQPPVLAEPGHWHTAEWQGAVMTASELLERTGEQSRSALGFVQRALTLCRGLIS